LKELYYENIRGMVDGENENPLIMTISPEEKACGTGGLEGTEGKRRLRIRPSSRAKHHIFQLHCPDPLDSVSRVFRGT
jgi:hypothetical protein